jgi:hypothetical protein
MLTRVVHDAADYVSSWPVASCDRLATEGCAKPSAAARLPAVSHLATLPPHAGSCAPACGSPVSEGLAGSANGRRGGAGANVPIPTSYWKSRRQTHSAVSSRNLPHRNLWEERRTLPLLARAKKCAERFSPETDMPAVCKKRMASSLLRSAAARDSSEQYCSVIRYQEVLHGAHSGD